MKGYEKQKELSAFLLEGMPVLCHPYCFCQFNKRWKLIAVEKIHTHDKRHNSKDLNRLQWLHLEFE